MTVKTYSSLTKELIAGAISGFMLVIMIIAFTALIFKGPLALYFSIGIGCTLIGSFVVNLITASSSSIPFSIARPQPIVGAILAIMLANITTYHLSEAELLSTVLADIMLVTLIVGIYMFLLGYFQLGQAARFLPHTVIGGVIVGSAWIMAHLTFSLVCHNDLSLQNILQAHTLIQLAIALGFAGLLLYNKHSWVLPVAILFFSLLVAVFLRANHISHEEAERMGWFFSTYKPIFVFPSLGFSLFKHIDWLIIIHQTGYFFCLVGLITLILLFNLGRLETSEKLYVEVEHELKLTGLGNLIGGFLGAFPSNFSLNGSLLNKDMGAKSRISGIIASFVAVLILLIFPASLKNLPIPIVGGVLLFIAFKIMIEWLYEGWYKLPRADYFILLTILLIIAVWNFLPGTFIGIIVTCVVFVIRYAKINAIKYSTSGEYYHSNVIRPVYEQKWLTENGNKILVFKLQGYLFFGSTKALLDQISQLIAEKGKSLQFLIFDFQLVNNLDSSAGLNWVSLQQLINPTQLRLLFTHCSPAIIHQLKQLEVISENSSILLFPDLDKGLEWCEQQLLKSMPPELTPGSSSIVNTLSHLIPDKSEQQLFTQYLEKTTIKTGQYLFKQGEKSDSFCFIDSGEVSVLLEGKNAELRLSKSGPGTIIGEIGFYLHIERTASVRAETDCIVYKLTEKAMKELEKLNPKVALVFHKNIIYSLANRLVQTDYLLENMGAS